MQTSKFYNSFSPFYPIVDVFLKPQKKRLFREVNSLPPGKLLEIGIGTGKHLNHYKGHRIVGIDTSEKMLQFAKEYGAEHIEIMQMNGEALNFADGTVDYIVLSHVIAVVDHPVKLLKDVYRVLKVNGKVFILNHFTPNNCLQYIDYAFRPLSRLLHFRSVFHINCVNANKKFTLLKEINLAPYSYFKLLIYGKA